MSRKLLQEKKEILGLFYLLNKIKGDYIDCFSVSDEEACKEIEALSEDYGRKVSKRSFRRILNFEKEPIISVGKMNDLISWYTKGKYNIFKIYIRDNKNEIINFEKNNTYDLDSLQAKIQDHMRRSEHVEEDSVSSANNKIEIFGIESGKNTSIKIKKTKSSISIKDIKSGDNTEIDT